MEGSTLKDLLRGRGVKLVELSRLLDVDKATVTRWAQNRVPAERVLDVERVTDIPRHELRPDIYPTESADVPRPAKAEHAA